MKSDKLTKHKVLYI